jgi:Fibronectin type III domain
MTVQSVANYLGLADSEVEDNANLPAAEIAENLGIADSEAALIAALGVTPPNSPTAVVATVTGISTVSIAFTPPTDNGGAAIEGYDIAVAPSTKPITWDLSDTTSPIVVTCAGGFTAATSHVFTVAARNSAGAGSVSAPSAAVTPNP